VRGQAQDFDTWARMGNRGWSYADVLPFFKRMESYAGEGEDAFRGREGPLRVTNPQPCDPLFAAIIKAAAAQVGIQYYPNYNGASQEGIAMSQATMAADCRMSTARSTPTRCDRRAEGIFTSPPPIRAGRARSTSARS
jgi:choline dehydrogenase